MALRYTQRMTDTKAAKAVELIITRRGLDMAARRVNVDETVEELTVDTLSVRGAQREMTGWMISQGYKPLGRWETLQDDEQGEYVETSRTFMQQ